jgi:hypothetical protein
MNLDHQLKPVHRCAGLHLEDDEDFVYLFDGSEGIGVWRSNIPLEEVLATADLWISADNNQRQRWSVKVR